MNIGQPSITKTQWLNRLFPSENMSLTPLSNLTNTFKKVLKKDRICKIKLKKMIRKCSYFPILWSKFIL